MKPRGQGKHGYMATQWLALETSGPVWSQVCRRVEALIRRMDPEHEEELMEILGMERVADDGTGE